MSTATRSVVVNKQDNLRLAALNRALGMSVCYHPLYCGPLFSVPLCLQMIDSSGISHLVRNFKVYITGSFITSSSCFGVVVVVVVVFFVLFWVFVVVVVVVLFLPPLSFSALVLSTLLKSEFPWSPKLLPRFQTHISLPFLI